MGVLMIAIVLVDAGDSNSHRSSDHRGSKLGDPVRDGIPILYYGFSVFRNYFLVAKARILYLAQTTALVSCRTAPDVSY